MQLRFWRTEPKRRIARKPSYFRPCLEGFEDRVVPSAVHAPAQVAPAAVLAPAQVAQVAQAAQVNAGLHNALQITGVQLTNITIDANHVLHAAGTVTGTLGNNPFTATITDFALHLVQDNPNTKARECSVLHLELGPIHATLLGLHVDTSPICLDITATQGGGVLGNLLCGLADGAAGGILPTAGQQSTLESGLGDLVGGALSRALKQAQPTQSGDPSVCTGACEILHLVVGPVELHLLGLNVFLNNCADPAGPVQVCISATAGEGPLGDLLCGLTDTDVLHLSLKDITRLAKQATRLLQDGNLSPNDIAHLTNSLAHLIG